MLKGIVFDMDGTLVDSLPITYEAFNHALVAAGGRPHAPHEIMRYFGPGEGHVFTRILGCPEKGDVAYSACNDYVEANLAKIGLHEGVGDLLESLRSAGIPIAICTGRPWDTTEMILRHHGLLDRFVTVVANDHVENPKPAPDGLLLALSRMEVAASDALFVGDTWVDIRAAHDARATAVAAVWDTAAKHDELLAHRPHHWAKRAQDVWEIFQDA